MSMWALGLPQPRLERVLGEHAAVHGWAPPGLLGTYHDERHFPGARGMLQTQAQVALRRGQDPAANALRQLFLELMAYEQPLRHVGELIAGSDFRYPLPNPGSHPLAGAFAPDLLLRTEDGSATSVAELILAARPVFLDLAGRTGLLEAARAWKGRVDIRTARTDDRPADALLIRPDAYIAWAATAGEPADSGAPALREALSRCFGAPLDTGARRRPDLLTGRHRQQECASCRLRAPGPLGSRSAGSGRGWPGGSFDLAAGARSSLLLTVPGTCARRPRAGERWHGGYST